ncbi:MAG TPA: Trk system potassium uptake protein TrkA [Hyphomicrobiaceae bacterium MAG_BT-2024]
MRIIICGAGQVGLGIAERLAAEGNDVIMIDSSAKLVQRANDVLDVRATLGNGAHPDTLAKAGAGDADMLIAVTFHDEVNMVACHVASTLFNVPTKIARVRAQAYLDKEWSQLFRSQGLNIDYIISPEIEVGNVVLRRLELPGAFETASFVNGQVLAIGVNCGAECPVVDTPLKQLRELFPDLPATVVAIVRNGELFLPVKEQRLAQGDDVYLILPSKMVSRILKIFGHEEVQARRIVIAGGGNIGEYVAHAIDQREPSVSVKVIESRRDRAVAIAATLKRTVILNGSALSEELLREADIRNAETLVALTNDDQVNILTSVLARNLGCRSSLCLLNSAAYSSIVRPFGIDAQINPRAVTVSRILQYVRRGRIRGVHEICNSAGEIVEAEALTTTPVVGKAIKDLGISEGVRFGVIVRDGEIVLPDGNTELRPRDRAILFVRADFVKEVEQLFRVRPDYF